MSFWRGVWLGGLGALGLTAIGAVFLGRPLLQMMTARMITRLGTDKYPENLFEGISSMIGRQPRISLETALRAQEGKRISRPLATPKRFLHFDDLMFIPAQLAALPTPETARVRTETVIGPRAARPLRLEIPVLVSGMAYGLSLTAAAKIALAHGATAAGTATNSGEGGFFAPERRAARFYIQQYTRGGWPDDPSIWRQVDAIEIQAGQGAQAGSPQSTPAKKLGPEQWQALGLPPGADAHLHSRFPGIDSPRDFGPLVARLRRESGGVPVGIKIAAGHRLEEDLQVAVAAGVDFITIDGAQGASHAAEPILEDDFGLPTLHALCRTTRFLQERGLQEQVSVIVSGGLMTPGEFLKALALGATACAVGTAAIMAMVHTQAARIAPFEPPTQLIWHDGKHRDRFDAAEGARDLAFWFTAVVDEMVQAARALGVTDLHAVGRRHLCALTPEVAAVTGIQPAWLPPTPAPGPRLPERPDEVWPEIHPFTPEPPEPTPPAIRLPLPEAPAASLTPEQNPPQVELPSEPPPSYH